MAGSHYCFVVEMRLLFVACVSVLVSKQTALRHAYI